jgi:3-dehydroquinate synthase
MKTITLSAPTGKCRIMVGEMLANAGKYVKGGKVAIITDSNVRKHYNKFFPECDDVMEIGLGEENKTLKTVEHIWKRFLKLEMERPSFVLGIGGGIVCDVTGYAASNYLRGLDFGFAPTTLLAQVDAAIGGKNGFNFMGYKNIIGAIKQPKFCICDTGVLKTLPISEVRCGFAEIIKSAAIGDATLFALLESKTKEALRLDESIMGGIIESCATLKAGIVSRDESEAYERMKLNFGHTFGHAIEKTAKMPHGYAVAAGMAVAARISASRGMMEKADAERLLRLIRAFGLPVDCGMDKEGIMDAIRKDKKRRGNSIRMVLLEGIGKATITGVTIDEIRDAMKEMA